MGRPSKYSKELSLEILGQLAEGKSLRKICEQKGMPAISTVLLWRLEHEEFSEQYTHARELQAFGILDELLDISDDGSNDTYETENGTKVNSEVIQRSKLRIDTRKWFLAKMLPKVCGDKLDLNHSGEMKIDQVTRKIID